MPPKFKDLKRFCDKDGWELYKDTDHWYYRKIRDDGQILRTKISRAVSKELSKSLWREILSKQLMITENEFWEKLK